MTRDFTNFAHSVRFSSLEEKAPAAVVKEPAVSVAETTAPAVVAKVPTPRTSKMASNVVAMAVGRGVRTQVRADASGKKVSVNSATVEKLAAVKGLSEKLAERIVKNRPFASLEDLHQVKGLRTKLLAKVRDRLKL